jgi:hypothetical protein
MSLLLLDECKFDTDERVSGGEGDWVAYSQGHDGGDLQKLDLELLWSIADRRPEGG